MMRAKRGDTVKVHYTGKLEDGTVFDSSRDRNPLEFTIGRGQVIPGLEQAVIGMNAGESKTTSVPAHKAYGPYRDELVLELDQSKLPDHLDPKVGDHLEIGDVDGLMVEVEVIDVSDSVLVVDTNHPLAGRDLTFDIQLVEII